MKISLKNFPLPVNRYLGCNKSPKARRFVLWAFLFMGNKKDKAAARRHFFEATTKVHGRSQIARIQKIVFKGIQNCKLVYHFSLEGSEHFFKLS